MEFMDVVRSRFAVREYSDAPVDLPTADRVIEAAIQAPSTENLQPWAIGVLLDPKTVDAYGRRAKQWLRRNFSKVSHDTAARRMLQDPQFKLFQDAPALALIMARTSDPQGFEDCCLAAETFIVSAEDRNLAARWVGFARPWLNLPSVKAELGIPASYQVIAPIVLGYVKKNVQHTPATQAREPLELLAAA